MILGFSKQFVPYVLDGTKRHTIRGERKDGKRPQPGEMLHLWTGLRQKGAAFVLRAPCLRTEEVEIWLAPPLYHVEIAGNILDAAEMDALAWRDGFRFDDQMGDKSAGCFGLMMRFWDGRLPFRGWITHWDYTKADFERKPVNYDTEETLMSHLPKAPRKVYVP